MKKLGMITIGQAPRMDVAPIIQKHIKETAELVQVGVLDGLTKEQIEADFYPEKGEYVLTSRLTNGESVIMSREKIKPILQDKINYLERIGITQILLLCTGVFPGLTTKKAYLIEPDHIIPPTIHGLTGKRKLGVIVPLEQQKETSFPKYSPFGMNPVFQVATPYENDLTEFHKAAAMLKEEADLILLDCMGYTENLRREAEKITGKPVILSNALIAKLVSEMI
ncbi:AroM family protein [Niallia taxi]|uniref:AroM family protein n=1 Tax=Niallia TaxID=2837506 RepID=UPI00203B28C7|nr:AroM family protein [Niallia sp. MER 6]MCM3032270.1 AroM family protein [Niallia sp. MER 6]